jgi:hypothetical protein
VKNIQHDQQRKPKTNVEPLETEKIQINGDFFMGSADVHLKAF